MIHVVPWFKANHGTLSRKGLENLANSAQSIVVGQLIFERAPRPTLIQRSFRTIATILGSLLSCNFISWVSIECEGAWIF